MERPKLPPKPIHKNPRRNGAQSENAIRKKQAMNKAEMDEWNRIKEKVDKWDKEHTPQNNQIKQMMLDMGFREDEIDISKEKQ